MINHDVALRYSKALFHLGSNQEELVKRLNILETFLKIFQERPELLEFFSSPFTPLIEKEKLLEKCVDEDSNLIAYFMVLFKKHRFKYFEEIVSEYRQMVINQMKALDAYLLTSVSMDDETLKKLVEKLKKIYHKKIDLKVEVDPSLLGGGILTIGNQRIDFSIQGKLVRLKNDLLSMNIL